MNKDEKTVAEWLKTRGFIVMGFNKNEKAKSKTPDFKIYKDHELIFYCEVKTVAKDKWLEDQIKGAPPGEIVGGVRNDPTFNNIVAKIHEASGQFRAVNPDRNYPNVLVFINNEDFCGLIDFISVITGCFYSENGRISPIYKKYSEGRIRYEKHEIDLYIWKDVSDEEKYLFSQSNPEHLSSLCNSFGLDAKSIRSIDDQYRDHIAKKL
jgi:hypothetical protein